MSEKTLHLPVETLNEIDRVNDRFEVTPEEWDEVFRDAPCVDCDVAEIADEIFASYEGE